MERHFVMTAFGYAIVGLLLGIYMAATQNHIQHVTHAHIMLLGFVVSFIYAVCYRLWLNSSGSSLSKLQLLTHQVGTLGIVIGLYLLYSGTLKESIIGPILGISSILALTGLILMKVMLIQSFKSVKS